VRLQLYFWGTLAIYLILSVLDLGLTAALLRANEAAYESNPVAAAFLERHGWRGLAVYKAGGVVAFLGAMVLLLRHRPRLAASIVTVGCAVLLFVTSYSHYLLVHTHRQNVEYGLSPAQIEAQAGAHPDIGLPDVCWVQVE